MNFGNEIASIVLGNYFDERPRQALPLSVDLPAAQPGAGRGSHGVDIEGQLAQLGDVDQQRVVAHAPAGPRVAPRTRRNFQPRSLASRTPATPAAWSTAAGYREGWRALNNAA